MNNPSYLALVDCNNFFCYCERVFNPALMDKPVVVLSNNDGYIISRSEEAKSLGIPMDAPLHEQNHTQSGNGWKMRPEPHSPHYTIDWKQLPVAQV